MSQPASTGLLSSLLGGTGVARFNPWSLLIAFVGACSLIAFVRLYLARSARL